MAKYIPDHRRMEPLNIGVVVWADGAVEGRFLGEDGDDVTAPRLINKNGRDAYPDWIKSWRTQFVKQRLSVGRGRPAARRENHEFLDAIAMYADDHYVFVDGGFINSPVAPGGIDDIVNYLFSELVEPAEEAVEAPESMDKIVRRMFAPLKKDPQFRPGIKISCMIDDNATEEFPFTFGYGFDYPILMQQVPLGKQDIVNSTAFKFRAVSSDAKLVSVERCVSLIAVDDMRLRNDESMKRHSHLLGIYSQVVNLMSAGATHRLGELGVPLNGRQQ
ncbi:MAG: hypothetical protein WD069_22315 [Planctomycetales bacterium]